MMKIIFIAFWGALGALVRYGVSVFSPMLLRQLSFFIAFFTKKESTFSPLVISVFATLFCNVVAACLLGMLVVFAAESQREWNFFGEKKIFLDSLALGFCGSLSTFSTFTKETFFLWEQQWFFLAALNVMANVFFSLLFFFLFYRWAWRFV